MNKREWINEEIARRTEGKNLSKSQRIKIFKQVGKEAKRMK